ncbi:MAG TPA: hypothetical protein VJU81_11810, partial [Methylomirabilota bacterium]|nr:hypothetical protein [Methylomirabilota bacterium]
MPARASTRARRRRAVRAEWVVGCDLGGTALRVLARDAHGRAYRLRRGAVTPRALPFTLRAALRRWRI